MTKLKYQIARGRRFAKDEDGSPAVEFALVAPILLLMVFGIVQFGFAFFTYNEMMNGAREGARRMAVGATEEQAIAKSNAAMTLDRNYAFDPVAGTDDVKMTITLKISEAMVLSAVPLPDLITGQLLTASVTMHKE
jgi:Flp pilus assembly protein TadG